MFVEREGGAVILTPKTKRRWPKNFFDAIHIKDPKFKRPPKGKLPPIPDL